MRGPIDEQRQNLGPRRSGTHCTADIQAASAADLPLKPRYSHEQVTDQGRPRDSNSTAKEPLFQQFLEWLKKQ
jgi:hypothetical protein